MTRKRIYRFFLFQVILIPIAAISQILFVSHLTKTLNISELKDALYILNLSIFLIFTDFGTMYNSYRDASANAKSSAKVKFTIVKKYQRQSLRIAFTNLLISALFLFNDKTFLLGVYIAVNAAAIPGLVYLQILRGLGKDATYLIFYHSSWPMALLVLLFMHQGNENFGDKGKFLALLPTISLMIIGYIAKATCLNFKRLPEKKEIYFQSNSNRRASPITLLVTGAVALQLDKVVIARYLNLADAESYLFLGLLMISTLNVIAAIGTKVWGSNLSSRSPKYNFYFKEFILFGFGTGILFYCSIIFLQKTNYISIRINLFLLLIMSFTIFFYSLLISFQAFVTFKSLEKIRIKGNLIQICTIATISFFLRESITINSLGLTVLIAVCANLLYLCTYTRSLFKEERK